MTAITRVMYILYGYLEGLGPYVTENVLYPFRTVEELILDIVQGRTELGTQVKSGSPAGCAHSQ